MSDPTTSGLAALAGHDLGSRTVQYDARDAILYALAIGTAPDHLALVYERQLSVLPPYALTLALWAVEAAGALGAYDPVRSLHASQVLELTGPLPRAGSVDMHARIANVWDRGSAAVLDIEVTSASFRAIYGIYLPGMGGWGGPPEPRTPRHQPAEAAVARRSFATAPAQAALYRLTGDLHPVHIDPRVARDAGFDRPILHGLCTLGIAALQVADALGADPLTLRRLGVRFAAPVLPGDELVVHVWTPQAGVGLFEAVVGETTVLRAGQAKFSPAAEDLDSSVG